MHIITISIEWLQSLRQLAYYGTPVAESTLCIVNYMETAHLLKQHIACNYYRIAGTQHAIARFIATVASHHFTTVEISKIADCKFCRNLYCKDVVRSFKK